VNVWLVSPAWQRYAVTRMVLEQRRWMCDTLAARGLTANSVIVADDENLDIAEELCFPTVEKDNSDLGERFNAGYKFAAEQGADVFVHVGSDDWVHPDVFNILTTFDIESDPPMPDPTPGKPVVWRRGPIVIAQRRLTLVELYRGAGQRCFVHGRWGCIPWLIPRRVMEAERFTPIPKGHMRGIDGALVRGLRTRPTWTFQDAPDEWLVDWKTSWNVTPYKGVAGTLGVGAEEDPWAMLAEFYPHHLIQMAQALA
jgi:glycosyltransferase involved in cell wall biosynthesis